MADEFLIVHLCLRFFLFLVLLGHTTKQNDTRCMRWGPWCDTETEKPNTEDPQPDPGFLGIWDLRTGVSNRRRCRCSKWAYQVIPKHKRNYSNQIIFMLNYDRQQAGDAMRTDGYGDGDGMPCEADPLLCLCIHCIFKIHNCMMGRAFVAVVGF